MADIQQWRRRIQPVRARTPASAFEPDDTDDMTSPTTPKQGLKSKVSSYFDFRPHTKTASFDGDYESQLPTWPTEQLYPNPDAEDEMDSVMCVLMSDPYAQLDVRFNGSLMRVFERFMALKAEKELLQHQLNLETASCQAVLSKFNMAEKDWEDEKQDYKDEIKRYEILLTKTSLRGLAEVTLARQDSKLRSDFKSHDDNEKIFELIEKNNRFSDRCYSSQRATMKSSLQSPCKKDKSLSRELAQKKSITKIHAELPFGTPPGHDVRFSLAHISMLQQQGLRRTRPRAVTSSTDTSGDTFSAFSCEVGLRPPEKLDGDAKTSVPAAGLDAELSEIVKLAIIVAQRLSIDASQVLPQLLSLFKTHRGARADSVGTLNGLPRTCSIPPATPKPVYTAIPISRTGTVPARRQLISKASGLFNRLKPQQLSIELAETARAGQRRFSFEPGDDAAVESLKVGAIPPVTQDRLLRKSVSLGILPQSSPATMAMEQVLSPIADCTTTSVAAPVRPYSQISASVFTSGLLAKSRQDREDSSSSLLTAIRPAGDPSKRSSLSNSVYSSPSAGHEEFGRIIQGNTGLSQDIPSSGDRLPNHTTSLRGNAILSPATQKLNVRAEGAFRPQTSEYKASAYGSSSASSSKPDVSNSGTENSRPTRAEPEVKGL